MNKTKASPKKPFNEQECPSCNQKLWEGDARPQDMPDPMFCLHCGTYLHLKAKLKASKHGRRGEDALISTEEHDCAVEPLPQEDEVLFKLGRYLILSLIGQGGMGQVFKAYDTVCGRTIALKRIRQNRENSFSKLHLYESGFIREARITSQLNHPSIMPIYTIHIEESSTYYTMPLIRGRNLSHILSLTAQQEKKRIPLDSTGGSVPTLVRIFLNVCQAIAYAHSKNVTHRDIKPNNIMVGEYGHVLVLDWGLAKIRNENKESKKPKEGVAGCIPYMAPEVVCGSEPNVKSEIFSLGATFYQMLTLCLPFHRPWNSKAEAAKHLQKERFYDPTVLSPNKDIPRILSRICKRCLEKNPEDRYTSVDALIKDLEIYLEGRSDWHPLDQLDVKDPSVWEFQENIFTAKEVAISHNTNLGSWVHLMISKASFGENVRMEIEVKLGQGSQGIGFMLSIPESTSRKYPDDGLCIWIGSEHSPQTSVYRSTLEIDQRQDVFLQTKKWHKVYIEKIENSVYVYLDGSRCLSHISHLPLTGTHLGIVSRDANYEMHPIQVATGSLNVTVSCLAVPDAFLAKGDFEAAISEYQRIAKCFYDRPEGIKALFRCGVSRIEQAKACKQKRKAELYFDQANEAFHNLARTSEAPLEYLGKSLVYQAQEDFEEEIKCLELAIRKYRNRPLPKNLREQILHRMHDCSKHHRIAAYSLILLVARKLPNLVNNPQIQRLFQNLQSNWEPLVFIEKDPLCDTLLPLANREMSIQLAYILKRPQIIREIIDDLSENCPKATTSICNGLFCLIKLGSYQVAEDIILMFWELKEDESEDQYETDEQNAAPSPTHPESAEESESIKKELTRNFDLLMCLVLAHKDSLGSAIEKYHVLVETPKTTMEVRVLWYLCYLSIEDHQTKSVLQLLSKTDFKLSNSSINEQLLGFHIWALLLDKRWEEAGNILHSNGKDLIQKEDSMLFFLHTCWSHVSQTSSDVKPPLPASFPRSWTLLSHFLSGNIDLKTGWIERAFSWEKRRFYRQLYLYYYCMNKTQKANKFKKLEINERTIPYEG